MSTVKEIKLANTTVVVVASLSEQLYLPHKHS